jgi:hypothetical protein
MMAAISLSELATFATMRQHFQHQPDLQVTPIEKMRLPLQSRDELPPLLAGLQWVWMHPTLKAEILVLPYQFKREIIDQEREFLLKGGKMIFALPTVQVVTKNDLTK